MPLEAEEFSLIIRQPVILSVFENTSMAIPSSLQMVRLWNSEGPQQLSKTIRFVPLVSARTLTSPSWPTPINSN